MEIESVGYLLKRAQHALRLRMDEALRPLGLTTPQYSALTVLEANPGLSGAELARRCFVTAQTMNAMVVQLEAGGLIARRAHPEHGRVLQASLTPEGAAQVARAHGIVDGVEQAMLGGLDAAERRQLGAWLGACSEALGG